MIINYNQLQDVIYESFADRRYNSNYIKKIPFSLELKPIFNSIEEQLINTRGNLARIEELLLENNFKNRILKNFSHSLLDIRTGISKELSKNASQYLSIANDLGINTETIQHNMEILYKAADNELSVLNDVEIFGGKYFTLIEEYEYSFEKEHQDFIIEEFDNLKNEYLNVFEYFNDPLNMDITNKYENIIENYNIQLIELKAKIEKNDINSIYTLSEIYEKQNNKNNTEISNFLIEQMNIESLALEIKLTDSQKINNFKLFKDLSIGYTEDGVFHSINNQQNLDIYMLELEKSMIKHHLRKKPAISNFFIDRHLEENKKAGKLANTFKIIDKFIENEQILKNNKFDMTLFKNKSLEVIDDAFSNIIIKHSVEKYALSIMSNKYKHLLNDNSLVLFETIKNNNVSKKDLQNILGKKIAAIKTPEALESYLKEIINHFNGFTAMALQIKLDNNKIEKVYDKNNIIVFEVKQFNESKDLGSPSWCISRDNFYFNQYTSDKCKQFILYDFNKNEFENDSLIGFTLHENGKNRTQHLKNDDYLNLNDSLNNIISEIKYNYQDSFKLSKEDIDELNIKFKNNKKIVLKSSKGNL